ncbi:MAG: NfeD family protein [Paludibacteraceae bacterium]|nr:NfeD family protein [Paludibacteraceae bacterium]
MEPWHLWIIAGLVFFIIEIFTSGFAVICFSVGCVAAAVCSVYDPKLLHQLIAFGAFSFVAFVMVRPVLKKWFIKETDDAKTNTAALIGRRVVVSETIDPVARTGRVAVDGEQWKAISENNETIPKGTVVEITEQNSIILTIKKI